MKKNVKKILSSFFISSPLSLLPIAFISSNTATNKSSELYKLTFPIESLTFKNESFNLKQKVNFVVSKNIKKEIFTWFINYLSSKNIQATISDEIKHDSTNFIISNKYDNDEKVKKLFADNEIRFSFENNIISKYFIETKNNMFFVQGNDLASIIVALKTLHQIISNLDNNVVIGFNASERLKKESKLIAYDDLSSSYDKRKNNIINAGLNYFDKYVYAASNDEKNSLRWTEFYSESELNEIIEYKNLAEDMLVDFVYNIDVFTHEPLSSSNYEAGLQSLKNKLKQLINAGISSFSFSSTNVNRPSEQLQVELLNDIANWFKQIQNDENVNQEVLYFINNQIISEVPNYFATFNENVHPVINHDKSYNRLSEDFSIAYNERLRKKANFSLNWAKLFDQGKLSLNNFKEILDVGDREKVGLLSFSLSESNEFNNYTFKNIARRWLYLDNELDYKNSIVKDVLELNSLDSNLIRDFNLVADHINFINISESDVHQLVESSDIKDKVILLESRIKDDTYEPQDISVLKDFFTKLKTAIKNLKKSNSKFISLIDPWLTNLDQLATTYNYLLEALTYKKQNIQSEFNTFVYKASDSLKTLESQKNASKDFQIRTGTKYLLPSLQRVIHYLKNNYVIYEKNSIYKVQQNFFSSRGEHSNLTHGTTPDKIFLKSNTNVVVFNGYNEKIRENEYFGAEFSQPIYLEKIFLKMGDGTDHFYNFVFEYKQGNNDEWLPLNNVTYSQGNQNFQDVVLENLNKINVSAVRVRNLRQNQDNGWVRIFNFVINDYDVQTKETQWYSDLSYNAQASQNIYINEIDFDKINDNNDSTSLSISTSTDNLQANAALGISLSKKREITRILLKQGRSSTSKRLSSIRVEYFDYSDNTWKQFGSYNLDNSVEQYLAGYAITDKIRLVNLENHSNVWEINELKISDKQNDKDRFIVKSNNLSIASNRAISASRRNNNLQFIVDNNPSTYAWMSKKSNNGGIAANDSIDIYFNDIKEVSTVRILQESWDESLKYFKIQKILNGTYEDITDEIYINYNVDLTIKVKENAGKMDGIRILSTRNSGRWWALKEVWVTENVSYSSDNVYAEQTFKNELIVKNNLDKFTLRKKVDAADSNITLPPNKYIGIDLKDIHYLTGLKTNVELNDNLKIFVSNNSHSWTRLDQITSLSPELKGRYVVLMNVSNTSQTFNFDHLEVTTKSNEEYSEIVTSNFKLEENNFNQGEFDNDLETYNEYKNPTPGKYVLYNLGNINLNSLKLYSNTNSYNYPRNLIVDVSTDKEVWKRVMTITNNDSRFINSKLIDTPYGLLDTDYKEHRFWEANNINVQGAKFLRISVTGNYPNNRSLIINEIVINDNVSITKSNNAKFEGTYTVSPSAKTPDKIFDKNFLSYFEPDNENSNLIINIKESDYKDKAIRIFALENNLDATISAIVYDSNTNPKEQEIELGKLSRNLTFFNLPSQPDKKLIKLKIKWTNKLPKISEISILDKSNEQLNKTELSNLIASDPSDLNNWTKEAKDKYLALKEQASNAISSSYVWQSVINEIKSQIQELINHHDNKQDTSELESLVNSIQPKEHSEKVYTDQTFSRLLYNLNKAKEALLNKENIGQNDLRTLTNELRESDESLKYSKWYKNLASENITKYELLNKNIYTQQSLNNLKEIVDRINSLVSNGENDALVYKNINDLYSQKVRSLEKSELGALIERFEILKETAENNANQNKLFWPSYTKSVETKIKELDKKIDYETLTIEKINSYITDLRNSINSLESMKNYKASLLRNKINIDFDLYEDIYTKASYAPLLEAINQGKVYLSYPDLLNEKIIDDQIGNIDKLIPNLVLDKDKLTQQVNLIEDAFVKNNLIRKIEGINSKEKYLEVRAEIKAYNPNKTKVIANDINEYREAIKNLINKIIENKQKQQFLDKLNGAESEYQLDNIKNEVTSYLNRSQDLKESEKQNNSKDYAPIASKKDYATLILSIAFPVAAVLSLGIILIVYLIKRKK
ncbi:beta-N-acetylglucosaminidase domain-containing protein [Mycoplasmopsis edwardii]|nr:beta-N-acetylglucosaminidase domain-containing protein [Mycoplasmopsis edwardii]